MMHGKATILGKENSVVVEKKEEPNKVEE